MRKNKLHEWQVQQDRNEGTEVRMRWMQMHETVIVRKLKSTFPQTRLGDSFFMAACVQSEEHLTQGLKIKCFASTR